MSVLDGAIPDPNSGCWIWVGPSKGNGYGQYKQGYAHRAAYEEENGPIPKGMYVCHKCDTKMCINPSHLFVGTQAENLKDMKTKGRGKGNPTTPWFKRPKSKLRPLHVELIRNSSMSQKALADIYGVSRQTIYRVRRGNSHKVGMA